MAANRLPRSWITYIGIAAAAILGSTLALVASLLVARFGLILIMEYPRVADIAPVVTVLLLVLAGSRRKRVSLGNAARKSSPAPWMSIFPT